MPNINLDIYNLSSVLSKLINFTLFFDDEDEFRPADIRAFAKIFVIETLCIFKLLILKGDTKCICI